MGWPTTFASLAGGSQPLALFDTMFNQVAQMVAIPSSVAGTNALTLTPIGNAPSLTAYQNFSSFRFVAGNSASGVMTAQYQTLSALPIYLADGATQASTGNVTAGQEYVLVFIQSLNGGAGGFILENAAVPILTVVAGGVITNLQLLNVGGTPNTQVTVTWDELVMNNASGVPIRSVSQSLTCNAANIGVANGLDAGSLANTTWYAIWGISNGSVAATLASTSFTAPTLPAGYTYKKRLGAFRTDGSAHFLRIIQNQRDGQYQLVAGGNTTIAPNVTNGTLGTFSATSPVLSSVSLANFVPPTAIAAKLLVNNNYKGPGVVNALLAPNTAWGGTNNGPQGSAGNSLPCYMNSSSGAAVQNQTVLLVLEALSAAWATDGAGGALSILGWTDNI